MGEYETTLVFLTIAYLVLLPLLVYGAYRYGRISKVGEVLDELEASPNAGSNSQGRA